ncbi:hypothetical protein TNIN_366351 [Trichonephila inaurata madagascariensis]|uniref:Uncharacterized protein n=1 Tax=Trichonephila inaurata madagascariensis TaxID=2747483 RepID=A0A8X6Y8X9_9ARAC|nr:hypothetical protein TNIN_366351 [Trichonephila inaurata madagascariensis]
MSTDHSNQVSTATKTSEILVLVITGLISPSGSNILAIVEITDFFVTLRLSQFEVMGEILKAKESGCGFYKSPRVLISVEEVYESGNSKGLLADHLWSSFPAPFSIETSWEFSSRF